ncbi:TIGR03086 family metal-binding protein [Streptomyces europaeiscabiei]|uniref:TIGR03086 family metal-binding protein n=1 Tax=Streptomyces europaeiscabiei TaxID=146819 RepID=UPI0006284C62|nr:TIGR03086 family metal-binding protein [Streptomyces europaeiscabiei]MDX2523378.1 TIGR03086 family metal-binding protein [Streptomyces europaeiscabiei]MDX2765032.1 TIGR03086 family metal-binding protein [Streptomyces europaeiscabiei]MDX2772349.1 TIGR03086 family metal-binding protein [Streptomyces europaeiscabiei]MDX3707873.1 TIGR03086 family metal-binding protein [Streptomyces europaeiscabiei]MDX3776159.1 TIGR03086 family metal-binding protein [Streptomyces europaeiscabiei]
MKNHATSTHPHHRYMVECAAEAARVARSVTAEQLALPTHCGEWDVRALVNHWVLYTSHGLEHRALRKPLPEELTKRDFTTDPDWADAYAAQLDRAVTAWADPALWEGDIDLGMGPLPAVDLAGMIIKEMAVHGWDVATATGRSFRIPDAAAHFVLTVVETHGDLYRQYDGFADPVPVPEGAPVFHRALASSGRDPRSGA